MPNTSEAPYFVDQFVGTGLPGESFTLAFSPVRIDFVFFRKTAPGPADNPVHLAFSATAAGESGTTTSGAGNRTLTIGSKVVVPPDFTLYVGYFYFGAGYDSSLTAMRTSEQYDLQGDSESVTTKRKFLMTESDVDTHWTSAISCRKATTLAAMSEQENITNMPYNKFLIHEIKFMSASPLDVRLALAKQDDFWVRTDPDLDDMWGFFDIASTQWSTLGSADSSVVQYYWYWPNRNNMMLEGKSGLASFLQHNAPLTYEDEDGTSEIHAVLINMSADVDYSGGADKIKVWFKIEPIR